MFTSTESIHIVPTASEHVVIQIERIHYSVARNEAGSGHGGLIFHDQLKLLSNSPYHLLMSTLLRSEMSRGRWFFSWCRLPPRSRGRASPDPTTFAAMATSDNDVGQHADVACRQSSLVPLIGCARILRQWRGAALVVPIIGRSTRPLRARSSAEAERGKPCRGGWAPFSPLDCRGWS